MKFYYHDAGHLTNMSAMRKYGKIPLNLSSSPEPSGRFPRNLVYSIWDSGPIINFSNYDPALTLTYLRKGQLL